MCKVLRYRWMLASLLFSLMAGVEAHEAGSWIIRGGIANVNPDDSSSLISLGGTALPGTSASVEDDTQLGVSFTYKYTDHIGIEVLAATPFEHDIKESGIGFRDVGSTKHLPPTISLQYYPMGAGAVFHPYVGLGVNYTLFFSEDTSAALDNALGNGDMSLDDSIGLALQLGIDWVVGERWMMNAGLWKIDISTDADIRTDAGKVTVDVDIDPWVYMIGVAYRF